MPEEFELRVCPICSGKDRETLFRQRFEGLGDVSLLTGYPVVACRDCGFTFADKIPDKERFADYYANASKYEFAHHGGQQQEADLERLAALADWISQHCSPEMRLLDVGCATGELLVKLRERGFSNLTGLDPSPACVKYASEHHGLRVLRGVITEGLRNEPEFDILVLSSVLEHIPDLGAVLEQLQQWITREGMIVIEVPDAEHFSEGINAPYQEFSVEHVNFFSAASLVNLLGGRGFRMTNERHTICSAGPGVTGAVLTASFQGGVPRSVPTYEQVSKTGIKDYLRSCEEWTSHERRIVADLVKKQTPLFVWGAGTLCQRLLATTNLGQANITAFVDSNPHYQGKMLGGRPVITPLQLRQGPANPILITSWAFFDEISSSIREHLCLSNPILGIHR